MQFDAAEMNAETQNLEQITVIPTPIVVEPKSEVAPEQPKITPIFTVLQETKKEGIMNNEFVTKLNEVLAEKDQLKAVIDANRAQITKLESDTVQLETLYNALSGNPTPATTGKRRGRKPGSKNKPKLPDAAPGATTPEQDTVPTSGRQGLRGGNTISLKEAIVKVLGAAKPKELNLAEIAVEVPKLGYHSDALEFGNNCRQQLYFLEKSKTVVRNAEKKTWTLAA